MPEETLTTEAEKPSRRWGRAEWGPFVLFAGYVVATIIWNPNGDTSSNIERDWHAAIFGAMLCLPLQCALWTAWSPHPVVWRVPLGIAASIFLGLAISVKDGDPTGLAIFFSIFLLFYLVFSIARTVGHWHFFTNGDSPICNTVAGGRRFSVRYLLSWTAICALLLSLGRIVLFGSDPGAQSPLEFIAFLLGIIAVFGIALLPIIGIGLIVLGSKRRILLCILSLPLGIMVSALVMTWTMIEMNPAMPLSFRVIWKQMAFFSVGAALSMFFTALGLRYSGYRITRD